MLWNNCYLKFQFNRLAFQAGYAGILPDNPGLNPMKKENYRLYDNGGKTLDRYTCVFMDRPESTPGIFDALGFNADPYRSYGQHCSAAPGRHLGKRITLDQLPDTARRFVESRLIYTGLPWFSSGSGRIAIQISLADAETCSHAGDCEKDVIALLNKPYIIGQLTGISDTTVAKELAEYGAWDENELKDAAANWRRLIWIACNDIVEENFTAQ